jgi:hypothetical protein
MVGRADEAAAFVSARVESFPETYVSGSYYDHYKAFAARFFDFIEKESKPAP